MKIPANNQVLVIKQNSFNEIEKAKRLLYFSSLFHPQGVIQVMQEVVAVAAGQDQVQSSSSQNSEVFQDQTDEVDEETEDLVETEDLMEDASSSTAPSTPHTPLTRVSV